VIRRLFAGHRSLSVTILAVVVVVGVIVTTAIVSSGYKAQHVSLGDAAVWVTNQAKQLVGRANTQVKQLNSVVPSASDNVDVVQSGTTILSIDHSANTVSLVNPATSTPGKAVPLPSRDPAVFVAGTRVAIESETTGQLWLMPKDALADFDPQATPTINLGGKIVTTVDSAGHFFAYSPGAGEVYGFDAATQDAVDTTQRIGAATTRATGAGDNQLSTVNGNWVLYDPSTRVLRTASDSVTLPGWLGSDAVLQQATTGGDTVYVSSSAGLVAIPLGGQPRAVMRGTLGKPAAPVQAAGCAYAAWASGAAWRSCDGPAAGARTTLPKIQSGADLVYRVNDSLVVLNDARSGTSWAVQHGDALIDNWSDFAKPDNRTRQIDQNTDDTPPNLEKTQVPPVAVDDQFGARPGVASVLPVLLNDYDANGDVLVISAFDQLSPAQGKLELINNDQQLQLTLPATASGELSFGYTITDGRGGSASATVKVTVRLPDQNSPPVQVRPATTTVQSGGRVSTQVLTDWYDPDGDPFYLSGATVDAPDSVSFTPDGTVVYTDKGAGGSQKGVSLVVSDGKASSNGSLAVSVKQPGSVPIITEPFVATATAGEEITVSPLDHVHGGTGTVRLSAVPAKPDATITPDYDGGTFRFSSESVGAHYLDFTVTDGQTTANGTVRINVMAPPEANTQPITVPHTAFIQEQGSQDVDVLATDIDPAGGVLLVTGVSNVDQDSGLRVEILDQKLLRVTLTKPIDNPVTFNYRVSNGLAEAEGSVTVVQIARPAIAQPPIANPDTVSVRVGDSVDIPVLANDEQPDGEELTLDPKLASPLPSGAGLLFASGSVLRYLAPNKPGDYTAAYRVTAADGQWASAQVTINVREVDAATNNPPVPETVTARVFAGSSVRIPIPLDGIDPDGDSVKLLGQVTNPQDGAVTRVGTDWIEYQAGQYASGTDSFSYGVVDSLGARATGTIRVGIAPQPAGARNPVAVEDQITVRPDHTALVQVLANDSDPDGSPLTITSVKATGAAASASKTVKATVSGDVVKVTTPQTEGRYGFIYVIENATGGTSSNFLTVIVSKSAPLARPLVSDTVLSLSDVLGHTSVEANVLANVFFADGPVSSLKLAVLPGYTQDASVTSGHRIRVDVTEKSQIIPFSVANPDDLSIVSYGFLWVPGRGDALPQLKSGAPKLTVPSESTLTIHLNDYVVAALGKKVQLTDASTVHATHANGDDLVQNGQTLVYTSAARYFGPASISFEVTDGDSPTDPKGHVSTLVLPITVTPRQNQPPSFTGGQIDFEPGQRKTVDLVKLTSYPYAKDQGELSFKVIDPVPDGFTATLDGQQLSITAGEKVQEGSHASLQIDVKDSVNNGQSGRIDLAVVPSTQPLAVPQPDSVVVKRGSTTSVDVLANDEATNPFPETPLKVIAVRGIDQSSLPSGISISPSADNSTLSVSVDQNASPVDVSLQYEVADATGDPARYAWGTVTISVEDRPDPVADLQVTGVSDHTIALSWGAGAFNNSPITGYQVTLTDPASGQVLGTTNCPGTTCSVQTPGNGPGNKVNVSVTARNGVGVSDPTSYGSAVWSNIAPPAPTNVTATAVDGGATVDWQAPSSADGASPVTAYIVTVGGSTVTVNAPATEATVTGLANGTPVSVTVASTNEFYGPQPTWLSSAPISVTPAGAPIWTGTPVATAATDGGGDVSLSWSGLLDSNGRDVSKLGALAYQGAAPSCGSTNGLQVLSPTDTSTTFSGLDSGQNWNFVVFAYNGQGCTSSPVTTAMPITTPAAPTQVKVTPASPFRTGDQTTYLPQFAGAGPSPATPGTSSASWEYQLDDGGSPIGSVRSVSVGDNLVIPPGEFGKSLTIQVRSVVDYGGGTVLRSAWSNDSPSFVAVDLDVDYTTQTNADGSVTYSWTSAPQRNSSESVTYQCGATAAPMDQSGSCTTDGTQADLTVAVTIAGVTGTFSKKYPPVP
jgi:hypothetical protein